MSTRGAYALATGHNKKVSPSIYVAKVLQTSFSEKYFQLFPPTQSGGVVVRHFTEMKSSDGYGNHGKDASFRTQ
ncbi:MAG: hypothetical protein JW384_03378 [Nitrosomonadaceae bacterium]|nr:hypothetical protein [Nitrosomonadaceae bacterium]